MYRARGSLEKRFLVVESTSAELRQKGEELLKKLEARMEKVRREIGSMKRYQHLNPARRQRLNRYEKQLVEARNLWHSGDWRDAISLLRVLDESYPSAIGLVYGMSRRRKHRDELHDIRRAADSGVPYVAGSEIAGAQSGFSGVGGGDGGGGGGGC